MTNKDYERLNRLEENYTSEQIISLYNEYCYKHDLYDSEILDYDQVLEFLDGLKIEDVVRQLEGLKLETYKYYQFNGYGWLEEIGNENDTVIEIIEYADEDFFEEVEKNELYIG